MLGFVSMFMDVSSESIHSLLPVFLVTVLGASTTTVGLIEGIGEATAAFAKMGSGWLSDRLRKRKLLAGIGYGMAAVSKPLFAIATSAGWVFAARLADRVGKGIRGAPRDAMVADIAGPDQRGAAFGLRQSLDTIGAFAGPLLAITLMAVSGDNYRLVFWVAVIPAVAAVAVLVLGVREPPGFAAAPPRAQVQWTSAGRLPRAFWAVAAVGGVFTVARFSEAFLVLRAQDAGLANALVPAVLVVMNVVYAVSAYPIGVLSDRVGRRTLLMVGFAILIVADAVLAWAGNLWGVFAGVALWGLHMGTTQGLLAAMVADTAPADLRGTAFGLFNLVSGVALLAASVLAGVLWDAFGPAATFSAGAAFTLVGLAGAMLVVGRRG